jgi:hypothetical protein
MLSKKYGCEKRIARRSAAFTGFPPQNIRLMSGSACHHSLGVFLDN